MSLIHYISVYIISAIKFLIGPAVGYTVGLSFVETVLLTLAGMMSSVLLVSFAGGKLRKMVLARYFPKRKIFNKKSRRLVRFWRKYGLTGVALLTPVFFSPIGGTLIAVLYGEKWQKITLAMLISAFFWTFVICILIYTLGNIFVHV